MGLALAGITKAIAITPKQIEWEIHTATIAEAIPLTLIRVNQETSMAGIAGAIASKAIRIDRATATRMTTKATAETVRKWVPLLNATEANKATCSTFVEHFHLRGTALFAGVSINAIKDLRAQLEPDRGAFGLHVVAISCGVGNC